MVDLVLNSRSVMEPDSEALISDTQNQKPAGITNFRIISDTRQPVGLGDSIQKNSGPGGGASGGWCRGRAPHQTGV